MNEFSEGDKVGILPWTFHNSTEGILDVTFIRYMAGYRYAIVLLDNEDFGTFDIRVQVKDLIKE